ncbi:MAG: cytochrome c, partial [Pontibacter sp.]|nr:cytochrome c [Pontibacter sp.]
MFEKFNKVPMPSFAGTLSEQDIQTVIAYIKEASTEEATAATPPAANDASATPAATATTKDVSFMDLPPLVHVTIALSGIIILLIIATLIMLFRLFV